jgi:RNA polymerase sigma-70 factor, ECF subfamily
MEVSKPEEAPGVDADLAGLLEGCRRGDPLAWEALVRNCQNRVFGVAYHYLRSPDDARDVAQEVFVRIYRNLDAMPSNPHFYPWLFRITRNACIDFGRRRLARRADRHIPLADAGRLADNSVSPEETAQRRSRAALFHRALERLGRLNREIILLKEIQGLGLAEIASRLRVPLGTIKSRSHRARLELARQVLVLSERSEVT